jgi:gas vesicle protein
MSDKKNKSTLEKLILGAVIGAAVGSVIGASVAPEDGKSTRKKLSNKIKDLSSDIKQKIIEQDPLVLPVQQKKKQSLFSRIIDKFKKVDGKPIPSETESYDQDAIK